MADNVAITAGAGTFVAADDIGGIKYQRVKISLGADGTANDASAGAGAVGTGTQRITLASDDPAVVDLAAIEVLLTTQNGYLDGLEGQLTTQAGYLDGLETKLDTLISSAGTELPAGAQVIGRVGHDTTGIGHGVKTVTTAGTDVVLAASTAAKWVTIQSQTDNTGWIAVGATGVDATIATGTGVLLDAGESITLPCDNLADIFIDATVNGEGVRFTYGT